MSTQAVRTEDFVNSIGINTHLDFSVTAYNNVSIVESALNYLGVAQVRDAMQFSTSPALFAEVAAATGVKYDLFLAPGSGADLDGELQNLQQLPTRDIQSVEGRNEPDLYGPGFQEGIADQVTLYQFAQLNLPVYRSFRKVSGACRTMATRAISPATPIMATPTPISAPATIPHLATGSVC